MSGPVAGLSYAYDITLIETATGLLMDSPPLATGDFKLYRDGLLDGNLDTLPTASGVNVAVLLSIAELTGVSRVLVVAHDPDGVWGDASWSFPVEGLSLEAALTTVLVRLPGVVQPQTGDAFARIGAAGVSLSAIPDLAGITTLLARLSVTRTDFLDKLNISGNVASSAETTAIQNNTRVVRVVPDVIERPDSGMATYRVELLLYDETGNMEVPDSAPTIALVNQAGTDRSSRLDSTTMALVSTGRYRAIYTADVADTLEQLVWAFSVVEGGNTRIYGNQSLIVDTTAVDFTSADRTKLNTLHDTRIPGVIQPQTGDAYALIGANGSGLTDLATAVALAAVQADTDNIQTRLPAALVSGRMDSSAGAMALNVLTASALATDAVTEIQNGLSTLNPTTAQSAAEAALVAYGASTYAGGDTAGTGTLLTRIPGTVQPQTGDSFARLGANGAGLTALATAVALAALNNLSAAQVNAEAVDALATDLYGEPSQGAPGVSLSLAAKINYLYCWTRNKKTNDGVDTKLFADDGSTVLTKQLTSESGGTVTKAEWITGA